MLPHARHFLRSIFSFFTPILGIVSSLRIFHYAFYFSVTFITTVTYLAITLFTMQLPKAPSKKILHHHCCGPIGINNFHSVPGTALDPLVDVPQRLLVLSSYMTSQAWHGYTRKLGRNPVSLFGQINKIAKHALYLLLLFNAASVLTVSNHVTSSQVYLLNLPTASCTWVTNIPTAVHAQMTSAHGAILNACPIHQSAEIMLPSEGDTSWNYDEHVPVELIQPDQSSPSFDILPLDADTEVCFTSDQIVFNDATAFANISHKLEHYFAFGNKTYEFALDNCATHHVCTFLDLFVGPLRKAPNIGIRGINGIAQAQGLGSINITVRNSEGIDENITLHNVIYLPQASKSLISISKWAHDNKDDCGIFSRETFSIFLWNNDTSQRLVPHPPNCKIPVLPVNEGGPDDYSSFLSTHSPTFCDNISFLARSTDSSALDPEILKENIPPRNASPNALAQQTTAKDSAFPPGTTVKYNHSSTNKLCQIISSVQDANDLSYTIRVLGSKEHHNVHHSDLDALSPHQPSEVPASHTDIDPASLQKCLTREDLSQIWEHSPDSISPDQRLFLYWHQRLDHPTMQTMHKLALKGVIPRRLSKVTKMPPCAACIFAKMQKRRWREAHSKGGSIRDAKDTSPGSGTSCDHIISAQPGLIPQSTGTLTYKRFGGAVLFIDHFSGFQYVHLIQSTTAAETLTAKREYERAAHSFGVTIKRYRADNSRFDEKDFQTDCRRLH